MPTYEYRCDKCKEVFTLVMTMSEHGRKQIVCPSCRATRVTQLFTSFYAKTSKKS